MPTKIDPLVLTDAEELNRKHPTTFKIPSKAVRDNLQVGHYAKLCFDDKERMWVLVEKRIVTKAGIKYKGVLNNDPVVVRMKDGDEVHFEPRHVYSVLDGEGESIS